MEFSYQCDSHEKILVRMKWNFPHSSETISIVKETQLAISRRIVKRSEDGNFQVCYLEETRIEISELIVKMEQRQCKFKVGLVRRISKNGNSQLVYIGG